MTSTETYPVDALDHPQSTGSRSKSVLFCPDCGYEAEATGDWIEDDDGETTTLRCPVCHTVVSDQ